MVDLARSLLEARGYSLSTKGAEGIRLWVAELAASGVPAAAIRERIVRLVDVVASRAGPKKSWGPADSVAAMNRARPQGGMKGSKPADDGRIVFFGNDTVSGGGLVSASGMVPVGGEEIDVGKRETRPPSFSPLPPPAAPPPASAPVTSARPQASEPPRSVYALLDAPSTVVAEAELDVRVGLSATQSAGVIGDALVLPPSTEYPYVLSLQLVAEGFELADGGAWRREVTATEDAPYPSTVFRLRSLPQEEAVHPRALQVIYSVGGQTIGFAVRPVAVVRTAADRKAAAPREQAPSVDMRVPTERAAPDLTIHILHDPEARERLLWTLESPHEGVAWTAGDAKRVSCDIGEQPREFARQLVQQMSKQEGKKSLKLQMNGIGKRIAQNVPQPVWDAIHAAARAAGGPPSILILSAEAHIPWELAAVPAPLLVEGAPPFLGAQANVGRWVLGQGSPQVPPPHDLGIASMAVVWGVYSGPSSKFGRLVAAEEEAAALLREYKAEPVDAKLDPVLDCLLGTPPAHALHFAIHGVYNPGGLEDGLMLTDGQLISPIQVSGAELPQRPFVFLNACQVGSGQEVLGDYAGMASAFLDAHASAVIAPLWSIKDTIARDISLTFYREAFEGEPVATVLRRQRARYGAENSATYLAYQYFGHPELRIRRASPAT
jgi:CHAT domain-containing protein